MSALKICPQCGTEYELDQRFCPKDGSTLKAQNATDLVGSIVADRYHVLRKIGEGGMGTVYLAEHVKMGRKSAVKVMSPAMVHDADAISRFNREAANASKINHPNVAAIYDFGETEDGTIYLAMEYVDGPSLTRVIASQGALPPMRAADIARQVADALTVAHDMGIVHRDLKPDNIMITKNRDGTDCAKVVDFGIAKAANVESQKVTRTGHVIGTPEYMSPEQLAGDALDGRSDIYALGLVTFNMLTGKLPFPAETLQESMIMRLTERPKQLADMKGDVAWPQQVQAVLDRTLERAAAARYQTANEFGRELYTAVKGMRDSTATRQVTEMVDRSSPTETDPSGGVAQLSTAAAAIPPTRVNNAPAVTTTAPRGEARPAATKGAGRGRMVAAVAAVLVAVGVTGAYLATRDNTADPETAATPQRDTTRPRAAPVVSPPPAPNISRELEGISALIGDTTDTEIKAESALVRLAALETVAQAAADTSFLHFRFLRAKALMSTGDQHRIILGCDSLKQIEGRLATSPRFGRAVQPLLRACPSGLP